MTPTGARRSTAGRSVAIRILVVAAALALCVPQVAHAGPTAGTSTTSSVTEVESELAERFVPILMLKEQEEDCDTEGEPYGPTSIDIVLDNPEVALRQVGPSDPVVVWGPSAADLIGLGEGFHLDFPGSALAPGCIYERDFEKYSADIPPTVYAHVVQQPGSVFLQYWFYWYYNDWNNKHESDWEGITLRFEVASVEEALTADPVAVGYSQHEGGERSEWDDPKLERDGDRPVVYSSAGSHASYFGSAIYLGRSASEGFGCDDTSGPSKRVDPEVVTLPDRADDPDDPLAWLSFEGRWGERQSGPFNGPTGPAVKDRWLEPAPWFDELRASSVVIPSAENDSLTVFDVFCGVVEFGSSTLIDFTTSPATVILAGLVFAALTGFLSRRTDWSAVAPAPVERRRRVGQIFRLAVRTYASRPLAFIVFGLVFVPVAFATGLIVALVEAIPFVGSLLALAGQESGTGFVVSTLAGSVANVAGYVFVNGAIGVYLRGDDRGAGAAVAALRTAASRWRDLIGSVGRSFLIVFVLLVTVIGIPWAVRQIVRYQFVGPAVVVEGHDGRSALRRSSHLVHGRWWHTAVVTAVLNGGVAVLSTLVGVLLLVAFTGIPLWVFSGALSIVSVVAIPLAALALNYLHGDAVADDEGAPRAALTSSDVAPSPVTTG